MTKEEFYRWKHDGKEIFNVIRNQISQVEETLAREAGLDSLSDRYKAGIIRGMELVLDVDWEEEDTIDDNS